MENWFGSFINCCRGRKKPSENKDNASEVDSIEILAPAIEIGSGTSKDQNYVTPCFGKISDSRRSTRESLIELEKATILLVQLQCALCYQKASGYCLGCPDRRYCSECFLIQHPSPDKVHKFCQYSR